MTTLLQMYKSVPKTQLKNSVNWYNKANNYANYLSTRYKVDFNKVCAVISALSPACKWEVNKKDAEKLILCYVLNDNFTNYNISTYSANIVKAWNILVSTKNPIEFFSLKTGAKTYNFYLNILQPSNDNYVTIDRHAIAIHKGNKVTKQTHLTVKQYNNIANDYKETALKVGLIPCQLQAVLWEYYTKTIKLN